MADAKAHKRQRFEGVFAVLRGELLAYLKQEGMPQDAVDWFRRNFEYNVPGGKLNRGLSVVDSVEILKGRALSDDEYFKIALLGWCIELPCWNCVDGVGYIAINDSFMLEGAIYYLLKKHFRTEPCYVHLLELFHDTTFQTELGQLIDLITAPEDHVDLSKFSLEKHQKIVIYKTAYYSFYLPAALAMCICGIAHSSDPEADSSILNEDLLYGETQKKPSIHSLSEARVVERRRERLIWAEHAPRSVFPCLSDSWLNLRRTTESTLLGDCGLFGRDTNAVSCCRMLDRTASHGAIADRNTPESKMQAWRTLPERLLSVDQRYEYNISAKSFMILIADRTPKDVHREAFDSFGEHEKAQAWSRATEVIKTYSDGSYKAPYAGRSTRLDCFRQVVSALNVESYVLLQPQTPDPSLAVLERISAQLGSSSVQIHCPNQTEPPSGLLSTSSSLAPTWTVWLNILWFSSLICSLAAASIGITVKQWLQQYSSGLSGTSRHTARLRQRRLNSLVQCYISAPAII
ncbi:terpenoid synthase [Pilatotrama ljubarskyi]|nr:terpenoid synthase [Pilatotrama ljubarskyi]